MKLSSLIVQELNNWMFFEDISAANAAWKQGGEDKCVVIDTRVARKLVSLTLSRSPTVTSSSSCHRPGNLGAKWRLIEYDETCFEGFEWEQRIEFSSVAYRFEHDVQHLETCFEIGNKHQRWKWPSQYDNVATQYWIVVHIFQRKTKWNRSKPTRWRGVF